MGFTTGFTGGVTLTLGIAYLTVLAHERNRRAQAASLQSQSRVLTSLFSPTPQPPPLTRTELAREERLNLIETAKDRWNDEVEGAVRWVQRTDWDEVRERGEGAIARLWGGGLEKSREGLEDLEEKAGPVVKDSVERGKDGVARGVDKAEKAIDRAAAKGIAGAERAGTEIKEGSSKIAAAAKEKTEQAKKAAKEEAEKAKASAKQRATNAETKAAELKDSTKAYSERAVADAKSTAHSAADSIRASGGTIEAARGVVRDAVSKGIEKGKEIVGKAQVVVGLTPEQGKATVLSPASAVEKALQERYEKPGRALSKSIEETLEERYKPIEERDNTELRGV